MTPSAAARALVLLIMLASAARTQEPLEEVLVTGEQPGPAMWRVSKDEHQLWIVGTLTPLPAKMTWRSRQVESVVRQSGEILAGSSLRADVPGGFFGAVRLIPALLRLRANPDGATLEQILPPDVYLRWAAAHRKYFGEEPHDKERWRPMFAADALFAQALRKSGLSAKEVVAPTILKLAQHEKIRIRQREFRVPLQDPKGLIAELAATPRAADIACLIATLDRIEQDLPNMRRRAEAWAHGDVTTLKSLPYADQQQTCIDAALQGPRLRKLFEEQKQVLENDWLGAASYLLLAHATSLTSLPLAELLGEQGMLSRLRKLGYVVEEPRG